MCISSRKINIIMLLWSLAGISFLIFVLFSIHTRVIVDTAACLFTKTPDDYSDWLTHLSQLLYRIMFETCNHDYR